MIMFNYASSSKLNPCRSLGHWDVVSNKGSLEACEFHLLPGASLLQSPPLLQLFHQLLLLLPCQCRSSIIITIIILIIIITIIIVIIIYPIYRWSSILKHRDQSCFPHPFPTSPPQLRSSLTRVWGGKLIKSAQLRSCLRTWIVEYQRMLVFDKLTRVSVLQRGIFDQTWVRNHILCKFLHSKHMWKWCVCTDVQRTVLLGY